MTTKTMTVEAELVERCEVLEADEQRLKDEITDLAANRDRINEDNKLRRHTRNLPSPNHRDGSPNPQHAELAQQYADEEATARAGIDEANGRIADLNRERVAVTSQLRTLRDELQRHRAEMGDLAIAAEADRHREDLTSWLMRLNDLDEERAALPAQIDAARLAGEATTMITLQLRLDNSAAERDVVLAMALTAEANLADAQAAEARGRQSEVQARLTIAIEDLSVYEERRRVIGNEASAVINEAGRLRGNAMRARKRLAEHLAKTAQPVAA